MQGTTSFSNRSLVHFDTTSFEKVLTVPIFKSREVKLSIFMPLGNPVNSLQL